MPVQQWEPFADDLCAALTQRYPMIVWRVAPYTDAWSRTFGGAGGVTIRARWGTQEVELDMPATMIGLLALPQLLTETYEQVVYLFAQSGTPSARNGRTALRQPQCTAGKQS